MSATMIVSRTRPRRRANSGLAGRARRSRLSSSKRIIDYRETPPPVLPNPPDGACGVSGPRQLSSSISTGGASSVSPACRSRGRPPVADIEARHGDGSHRYRHRRHVCGARHCGAPSRWRRRTRVRVRCEQRRFAVARRGPRPTRHRPRRRPRVAQLGNRPRGETRGARCLRGRARLGEPRRGAQAGTDPSLQPVATMAKNIANLERVRAFRSLPRVDSDRPPPTASILPRSSDYTPRSSSVSRPSRWLSLVRLRSRRDTERSAVEPPVGAFVRARFRRRANRRRNLFARRFRNHQS